MENEEQHSDSLEQTKVPRVDLQKENRNLADSIRKLKAELEEKDIEIEEKNKLIKKFQIENDELKKKLKELEKEQGRTVNEATKQPAQKPNATPDATAISKEEHVQHESANSKANTLQRLCSFMSKEIRCDRWKQLGRELGLKDSHLDEIDSNHKNNIRETIYEMLKKWRDMNGNKVNSESLVMALDNIDDLKYLADQVRENFPTIKMDSKLDPLEINPSQSGLLTDDLRKELAKLENFSDDHRTKIIKCLKISGPQLQPATVVNVLEVWESQAKPMDQDMDNQRKLIYNMIHTFREIQRKDIIKVISKNKGPGFVGPRYRDMKKPISKFKGQPRQKLTESMAGWKSLAEHLKIDIQEITQEKSNPGEKLLQIWQTSKEATIGNLYYTLIELKMLNLVAILED